MEQTRAVQISRVKLNDDVAFLFAKLRMAYGNKPAQHTFNEVIKAAWYLVTQGADPVMLPIPKDNPKEIKTVFDFTHVDESYEKMYLELKRRLALSKGKPVTHAEVVSYATKLVYAKLGESSFVYA